MTHEKPFQSAYFGLESSPGRQKFQSNSTFLSALNGPNPQQYCINMQVSLCLCAPQVPQKPTNKSLGRSRAPCTLPSPFQAASETRCRRRTTSGALGGELLWGPLREQGKSGGVQALLPASPRGCCGDEVEQNNLEQNGILLSSAWCVSSD